MQEGFQQHDFQGVSQNCSDCACVYENDMLADIKDKMKRYKRPTFALEYHDN